jgi:hypothetical protein
MDVVPRWRVVPTAAQALALLAAVAERQPRGRHLKAVKTVLCTPTAASGMTRAG